MFKLVSKFKPSGDQPEAIKELVEEEDAWLKRLKRTTPILKGTKLILNNLKPHDTGFYSCHLKISKDEWFATFYSLIVLGQQFSAPAQMPFYLHSNLLFNVFYRKYFVDAER